MTGNNKQKQAQKPLGVTSSIRQKLLKQNPTAISSSIATSKNNQMLQTVELITSVNQLQYPVAVNNNIHP